MCFSVNVNLIKEELEERYGISFPDKYRYEPSYYYHAFGLPVLPAVCSENQATISFLKWGLIPEWIRNKEDAEEIRFKTFNARAESIDTKPSFSPSFRQKRCLIPVRGFYEWQHRRKKKIPWYVYRADNDIITLAGLYSEWKPEADSESVKTFTIITTEANELMAEVHNSKKRMPAILERQDEKKWLDTAIHPNNALEMLKPSPQNILKAYTIGPLVNDRTANRNRPEVTREFNWSGDKTLF